jgi:outer membrane lipoprotein-sorting protein
MFLTRLKIAAVVVLTLAIVGTGAGVLSYPLAAAPKEGPPEQVADPEPPPEKPKPPRDIEPIPGDPAAKKQPRPEPPPPDPNPKRLDEVLRRWHQAAEDIETALVHLTRTDENTVFKITTVSPVVLKYQKPDRVSYLETRKNPDKSEEVIRVLWTGSHLYLYRAEEKAVVKWEWSPTAAFVLGFVSPGPTWTLLRGMKPEEARKRFGVKLAKEDQWYSYLDFVPLLDSDKADFTRVRLVLNKETFLPRQLWHELPNGNTTTWDVTKIETDVALAKEDFRPEVPPGWKLERQPPLNTDPRSVRPTREPNPPPKTTGDRLDHLLQQLLESKRSDEQVFEALCLATLGRLPTDTEKKLVLGTVARHKDRKEAFAEVLTELTSTQEFSTHVEALGKRDPQRRPR